MDQFNIEDYLKKLFGDYKKQILPIGLLIVGLILAFQSVLVVEPEEVGVIVRLGKYDRTVEPGMNFKIPFVEEDLLVPVERQKKVEFGFRTVQAGQRTQYSSRNFDQESLMLTGDLNAANVEWIVQYRISDPYLYLFKIKSIDATFRDITEAVMREIIGDRSVNEVLTTGRQEVAIKAEEGIQQICNQYETGIKIEQVVLQDVNPPDAVKPSFNEVNEAEQEKEKSINQARSEYNKVIPRAKGEADKIISEAQGYAVNRINQAKGDAAKFNSVYREYAKAPEVTKQRIYLETMERVLGQVGKKLVTDKELGGILPLFQMEDVKTSPQKSQ